MYKKKWTSFFQKLNYIVQQKKQGLILISKELHVIMFQHMRRHSLKGKIIFCCRNMSKISHLQNSYRVSCFKEKQRMLKHRRCKIAAPLIYLPITQKVQGLRFLFRKYDLLLVISLKLRVFLVSWGEDVVLSMSKAIKSVFIHFFYANDI